MWNVKNIHLLPWDTIKLTYSCNIYKTLLLHVIHEAIHTPTQFHSIQSMNQTTRQRISQNKCSQGTTTKSFVRRNCHLLFAGLNSSFGGPSFRSVAVWFGLVCFALLFFALLPRLPLPWKFNFVSFRFARFRLVWFISPHAISLKVLASFRLVWFGLA